MQEYETRIVTSQGQISLVFAMKYVSDFVAIRAAQRMCRLGEIPEVWRGDVCIYASRESSRTSLQR